jgi:uncharacterized protein
MSLPAVEQQPLPPPGWYTDPYGRMRWWDGTQWGAAAPTAGTTDPRTMAMLAHALGLVAGFIAPLVILLMAGKQDPFVRHNAAEALNFHITLFVATIVSVALLCVVVGFLLLPLVIVAAWVFQIQGALAAGRGQWWKYPINVRLVSGAAY